MRHRERTPEHNEPFHSQIFKANESKSVEGFRMEAGEFPRTLTFEGQIFERRHYNPDQNNAVYDRPISEKPVHQTDILVVNHKGVVVMHYLWDARDSEIKFR